MPTKKKIVKAKKKKVGAVKAPKKTLRIQKPLKPIGVVTHFYTNIKVAIVKFKQPVKVGVQVLFRGTTTDFAQKISSIQYDHEVIKVAPKNKEVGLKAAKRVREGDLVYLA